METDQEILDLLTTSMAMFRDIKINYMEFLSSLKYENMADKVSNSRSNKKKTEDAAKV